MTKMRRSLKPVSLSESIKQLLRALNGYLTGRFSAGYRRDTRQRGPFLTSKRNTEFITLDQAYQKYQEYFALVQGKAISSMNPTGIVTFGKFCEILKKVHRYRIY